MGKEQKCWAVSSGWYSDYSILCVFERREDAIAYAAAQNKIPVKDQERWQELIRSNSTAARKEMDEIMGTSYGEDYRAEDFDFYPAGVVPVTEAAAPAPEGEN